MADTVIETLTTNFANSNLPVMCFDEANICTVGTDFIFDALNPACYPGAALPANGAAVDAIVNLARDNAPAINAVVTRAGAVTAAKRATGFNSATFDGKGWQIGGVGAGGLANSPLQITKVGVAANRVNEAALEGYQSVLQLIWARVTDFSDATGAVLFGNGQAGGSNTNMVVFTNSTSGDLRASVGATSLALGKTIALSELVQVGLLCKFNVGGTTTLTPVVNGLLGTPTAGPAWPSGFVANNGFALAQLGLMPGNSATDNAKTIYRAVREYVDISGVDVAAMVARDYAYGLPRFT